MESGLGKLFLSLSFFVGFFLLPALSAPAAVRESTTETLYLSGRGPASAIRWEFRCDEGRRCGDWETIPVPANWELEGFGTYNYGHDEKKSPDVGHYRRRFTIPSNWSGHRISLVFDGVMTDTQVWVNGRSAGPVHRGGFYPFRFDITGLVMFDQENLLEVLVHEQSANRSVNLAERDADYWLFGGIFRPVYLEAWPAESIKGVAIDARHDGMVWVRVDLADLAEPALLEIEIVAGTGEVIVREARQVAGGQKHEEVELSTPDAMPWSSETPVLYTLRLRLARDGESLHVRSESFGFRTVEIATGQGLMINGSRVLLKGVNRHVFRPDSGRVLDPAQSLEDALLIKSMNMNAVRTSHYPPEKAFLEACDELGIYVVDELAGWHDAYDSEVGTPLVRAMVERDRNHPSVIMWSNGNEGGWNEELDRVFADYDLQRRPVLHPRSIRSGIDAIHYPDWADLRSRLDPHSWRNRLRGLFGSLQIILPTEFLHGLWEGGSGAGLEEFWRLIRASPLAAGGFLWSFADESVVRIDRNGELDSDGNHAPDGVLGPGLELTANYFAVRSIWSPVVLVSPAHLEPYAGRMELENRFERTDLSAIRFAWQVVRLPAPSVSGDAEQVLASGEMNGPPAKPGERAPLTLPLDGVDGKGDLLRVQAIDSLGRQVMDWGIPLDSRRTLVRSLVATEGLNRVTAEELASGIRLVGANIGVVIDRTSGLLKRLDVDGDAIPIGPGPMVGEETPRAESLDYEARGDAQVVEAHYSGALRRVRWSLYPSGWIHLNVTYMVEGGASGAIGLGFPLPRDTVRRISWLGQGPSPIWGNRRLGGRFDIWESTPADLANGFLAGVRWLRLQTPDSRVTFVIESPGVYLGLFPKPFSPDAGMATAKLPPQDLNFLHSISAIGTKFHEASELVPPGAEPEGIGLLELSVWILPEHE